MRFIRFGVNYSVWEYEQGAKDCGAYKGSGRGLALLRGFKGIFNLRAKRNDGDRFGI